MALPTSSLWDLADFNEATIGSLLTLGPSDVSIAPSTSPYFSYSTDLKTLIARSTDGAAAQIDFTVGLPSKFTLEFVARFPEMPHDSADIADHRAGFTVADDGGRGISVYFSANGISISRVDDFGSVATLPDTANTTAEINTGFKTVRIAVDSALGRAYVYIGDGDTASPSFRYIIPVEQTPDSFSDTFSFFVKGTLSQPARVELRRLQLAASLVIPNFPPIADAGPDRVAPVGQAVRLDGRSSFDLEGAPLSYSWRAVDAPYGSSFVAELSSGATTDDGDGDGFTDRLMFTAGSLPAWVAAGDILVIVQERHVIETVNNAGGLLTVEGETLSDSLSDQPFRIVRQSLLVGANTETPYVVPDVQGIYRFELRVSDGEITSEPSEVLANVVGARTPFGVEPDVSPLWKALGDEWKFIENRGVFEEGWRAAAQILGGKLLEAWQHHYNFSVRDAQGTFQKKWVPFKTLVAETAPEEAVIELRYGLLRSTYAFESSSPPVVGDTLVFEYFTGATPATVTTVEVTLTGTSLSQIVADCNAALVSTGIVAYAHAYTADSPLYRHDGAGGSTTDDGDGDGRTATFSFPAASLPSWVAEGDTLIVGDERYTITTVNNAGGTLTINEELLPDDLSGQPFRIWRMVRLAFKSPTRGFRILSTSTAAATLGIETDRYNYLDGTNGALITDRTYYAGDGVDLTEMGVSRGDLLVLNNGQSFVVDRVLTGQGDPLGSQRFLLLDNLPFDATPEWSLPSVVQSSEVDYEMSATYPGDLVKAEALDSSAGTFTDVLGTVVAQRGGVIAAHLDGFYGVFADESRYELRLLGVKRRKAIPIENGVVGVPQLQDLIPVSAGPTIWKENIHYVLEPFYRELDESPVPMLQFRDSVFVDTGIEPPDVMWAELVLYDNSENVENLFGRLVGFLRDDASMLDRDFNYVAGVAGLMYSQQRGPRIRALEVGAQILFGQPFSEADGIITEVRHDFSPTRGRVIIQDDDGNDPSRSEIFRTYLYKKDPLDLSSTSGLATNPSTGLPLAEGDKITQFTPIGAGVDVVDLYNDPKWWIPFVRAGLITELEKFHTFTVQFNLDLITLANLSLLRQFVTRVRPSYTHPIVLGLKEVHDDLDVLDDVGLTLVLHEYELSCGDGPARMYDDYRGDGTIWSSFDDGIAYYDGSVDCPLDIIEFLLTLSWTGGAITYDLPFFYDVQVTDVDGAHTGIPGTPFDLTYDMTLAAGTYTVLATIKSSGAVLP